MTAAEAENGEAFGLLSSLTARGFSLRPETGDDISFLRGLYASTRAAELALTNWSDAQKLAFTDSQFDLQRHHYRTYYLTTEWNVLEDNGVPMGRLYLERRATTLLVIDIALLPEWRGRGLGTSLMEWVCVQARAAGKSVTVAVEKYNRAQTLYRRLGFRETADHGVHWDMQWDAAADQRAIVS